MEDYDWMNNPALKNIDMRKLEILINLANQTNTEGKSANEMMPLLMGAMSKANSQGVSFTKPEINLIIEVIKQGKPPEEVKKIENIQRIMSTFGKK